MNEPFEQHKIHRHPGLMLRLESESRGETPAQLSDALGIAQHEIEQVFAGQAPITPLLALRLQQHWEISAGLLISAQRDHDAAVLPPLSPL